MSKINVLDSSVFNRIAAGEVVERPASVVKELVENGIDSGATKIDVNIREGGKYIRVSDNGCGIEFDDLEKAFLPHATSKIREIKDLNSIGTLGFRGEALPSIASVAKISMLSRRKEDELGGEIIIENGRESARQQKGASVGTVVTVENLFKNVPARLKFLRSDRSEEGDVTSLVQKIIIANYNIAFSYTIGNKEIYRTGGNGLKEALYSVYGSNFLKESEFIECTTPDIVLYGYVNKPAFSKHNRSYQTLVVNGRYVNNADVSFWIYNCFSDFLMKRQYPAYVIFIDLPGDMVDINVHPNKMEVKFVDFDRIRRLLTKAISESLTSSTVQPKLIELNSDPGKADEGEMRTVSAEDVIAAAVFSQDDNAQATKPYPNVRQTFRAGLNDPDGDEEEKYAPPQIRSGMPNDKPRQYEFFHDVIAQKNGLKENFYEDISAYRYTGKLFNTYLMFECGGEVVMIDQHAAHEKVLYEEYSTTINCGTPSVQDLLFPYIFDVDVDEAVLIDENLDNIKALGFNINRLSGNTYSLSAVPLVLSDIRLKDFVSLLIDTLKRGRLSKRNFMKETLMQSACKAAVKGEVDLSDAEIGKLMDMIVEKKIELFCPHGRPIAIKIKRDEIEKWFKRIV